MTTHTHRWRLESPNGPASQGTCACGAQREFPNVFIGDTDKRGTWMDRSKRDLVAREGKR